jgi:NAD(P)-dependent dehydrogenase (short-subunit alcohol dehydrogenase family)
MNGSIKGRIALIVGAGRGLGRAIAEVYAREGVQVSVADLDAQAANDTLARIEHGDRAIAVSLDIRNAKATSQVVQAVVERNGRLDILVNTAAICLVDSLLEVTPERWDEVFAVNVRGAMFCMQAAARVMIPARFGRIINISSPASRMGFPNFASYAASKASLDSITKAAAVAWAPHGITVNCIVPGRMTEGMIDALEQDLAKLSGKSEEQLRHERTAGLPMGRRVAPLEVAEAAVWLASDAAAYVTAERFNFTGGMELS